MKKTLFYSVVMVSASLVSIASAAYARDVTSDILAQPNTLTIAKPEKQVEAVKPEASKPEAQEQPAPEPQIQEDNNASSLIEMLKAAYASSPTLRAGREALRQQYEGIAQAKALGRPDVNLGGGVSAEYADTKPGGDDTYLSKDASISATQFLYRGGRTLAEVERQLKLSQGASAAYDSLVQSVMLNVLTAAVDVQRDRATIELNQKNLEVLARQLDFAKKGFEVGELTRTDVAQAQARLAGGQADMVAAKAAYSNTLARFKEYAGIDADSLVIDMAGISIDLPGTLEDASALAYNQHPDIRAAKQAVAAAESNIKVSEGGLLPTLSLSGDVSQGWDTTPLIDESRGASMGVRATMPIYEGGATRSQIRQAKMGRYEKQNRVLEAARVVDKQVITAWNDYNAGKAAIMAFESQVEAAQLARDGVYKEREVGSRTILDTLDADAELLDAQVGLVRSRRDEVVAAFTFLSAIGGLTAEKLGITEAVQQPGYIEKAGNAWFGTHSEPLQ